MLKVSGGFADNRETQNLKPNMWSNICSPPPKKKKKGIKNKERKNKQRLLLYFSNKYMGPEYYLYAILGLNHFNMTKGILGISGFQKNSLICKISCCK